MSKTVLFQTIQLSIFTQFSSFWPIDRTLSGVTTPGQSGSGSCIAWNNQQEVLDSMQTHKLEFMCFISDGKPLKFIDQFIYHGSNISSTESNVNTCIHKPWTVIDKFINQWNFDLSDEIKYEFFQVVAVLIVCYSWNARKKSSMETKQRCCSLFWSNPG